MTRFVSLTLVAVVALSTLTIVRSAVAISPRNPYRTFNLSGVNYGSMRWERTHRQGRSGWPKNRSARRPQTRANRTTVIGGIPTGVFSQRSESDNGKTLNTPTTASSR
ncbi:MAG: hypothetical protein ABGW75_10380 [Pirellulales bacterium]